MNGVRVASQDMLTVLAQDGQVLGMLSEIDVGVLRLDFSGKVLYRNEYMANLIGSDTLTLDRNRWFSLVHPDDYMVTLQVLEQTLHSDDRRLNSYTSRIRVGASEYRWMQSVSIVERDAAGEAVSWLTLMSTLASREIENRMQRVINAGETRYRALFDNASDAMLLVHNGVVVDCNDAALAIFHATREQMVGISTQSFLHEASEVSVEKAYEILDQAGGFFEMRTRAKRLDGTYFDADSRLVRVVVDDEIFVLNAVRDITEQLANAREREQMLQTLAARNESLQWVQHASARLFAQPNMRALAETAIDLLDQHYTAACAYVGLMEGEMLNTIARSSVTRVKHVSFANPRYAYWNRVARQPNRILVIENVEDGLWDGPVTRAAMLARGVTTLVLVLLLDGDNELGAVALEYYDKISFARDSLSDIEVFSHTLALALARAKHLDAIAYQADHDSLTGLFNRSVLHREFQQWSRGNSGGQAALFLLDLDRFKEINDTLGHHVGDDLLRQIGSRLRLGLSYREAVVCRLGGDEFAVLLLGQQVDGEQVIAQGRDLLAALRRPFLINGVHLEISASIGIALYPDHGSDSHALLRSADVAMYEAKRSGAGVLCYDTQLDMHSPERLRLIVDLATGIRERELLLHYQPKLNLRSGVVIGCEALVRWQHPRQGLLAPDRFIPLAEMSDTIHALTAHVIDEACRQQQAWRERGVHLAVAVNLSARNLIDARVVEHIERSMRTYGLPPGALELEITETTLMHDPARAVSLLERIAALGVCLSVDDFGTGYSSLAYLRRLPIHALKIDRTFISDMLEKPQDAVIVQSIITLAHNLGLEVVAEGVETAAVLAALVGMGCDQAQGYHLSRPLPAAQLPGWLQAFDAAAADV
ncbi:MAG: EAL domain-containing protein [Spongiibacteraceae bacterium]